MSGEETADDLERLAQALLEKEVLNENDLREVLGERPYQRHDYHAGVTAEGEPVNLPPGPASEGDGVASREPAPMDSSTPPLDAPDGAL